MWEIELIVVSVLLIVFTQWVRKWRNPNCNGILPPGSMGLPFVGESLEFIFSTSYSLDHHPFIKKRLQRYGSIFRTNLLGQPVVVSTDPEFNDYIFKQEGNMVELHYMNAFSNLFRFDGEDRINATGRLHKYLRNLPLVHFGSEKLKEGLLSEIENLIIENLRIWSTQPSIDVKHASSIMVCDFVAKKLFSYDAKNASTKISEKVARFMDCLLSFPLNVPGTAFHKCMKDKEEIMKLLKDTLKERCSSQRIHERDDFLDQVIVDLSRDKMLTEDFIIILLFGILFAGSETNSTMLTFLLNFLSEHPSVWQELKVENESLLKKRQNPNSLLTWDEYKSLTFTRQVINESLRLSNIPPGLLRRSIKDMHLKGYTIPTGWTVIPIISEYHLNPNIYKDPLEFNPWRWKELDSNVVSKNFMPFGGGSRQCAGAEFAKAFLTTFLHVLATKYSWRKIKGGKWVRNPLLGLEDNLHIKFYEKHG